MTKIEAFEQIKELCFDNKELVDYCNEEIYKLQHKQMKAIAKGKNDYLDELAKECLNILKQSKEPMTREEILYKLNYKEDLTVLMIGARLSQLIKGGKVKKFSSMSENCLTYIVKYVII